MVIYNRILCYSSFAAVLRIRDILVRIRIRGSVTLTNGSGSWYFVIDLQDANKELFFANFFCLLLFRGAFSHHISKIKIIKNSQNSRNLGFSYYFCLMIEEYRAGSGSRSPKAYGSYGSGSGFATLLSWSLLFINRRFILGYKGLCVLC